MRRTLSLNGYIRNPRVRTLSLNGHTRNIGSGLIINPLSSRSSTRSSHSGRLTPRSYGSSINLQNDQNYQPNRLKPIELENKVTYLLEQFRLTNTIPELPDDISLEDSILIDDIFYTIIKLSPAELSNKIQFVVDEWRRTGDIIGIYGIHNRDAHIIYKNAFSLIRQLPDNGIRHNRRSHNRSQSTTNSNNSFNVDPLLQQLDDEFDLRNLETFGGGSKKRTYKKKVKKMK